MKITVLKLIYTCNIICNTTLSRFLRNNLLISCVTVYVNSILTNLVKVIIHF